jgi:hypothetical protein
MKVYCTGVYPDAKRLIVLCCIIIIFSPDRLGDLQPRHGVHNLEIRVIGLGPWVHFQLPYRYQVRVKVSGRRGHACRHHVGLATSKRTRVYD